MRFIVRVCHAGIMNRALPQSSAHFAGNSVEIPRSQQGHVICLLGVRWCAVLLLDWQLRSKVCSRNMAVHKGCLVRMVLPATVPCVSTCCTSLWTHDIVIIVRNEHGTRPEASIPAIATHAAIVVHPNSLN